jgi:hypothetical protein
MHGETVKYVILIYSASHKQILYTAEIMRKNIIIDSL